MAMTQRPPVRSELRLPNRIVSGALVVLLAPCASAEPVPSGTMVLLSSDVFRGTSVSAGRPVARVGATLDWRDGTYASVVATGTWHGGDVRLVSAQQFIGHAWRLDSATSVDVGLVNTGYGSGWSGGRRVSYVEAYAGLTRGHVATHVSLSPNYFRAGVWTLYADVEATLFQRDEWTVVAHAGAFAWLAGGRPLGAPTVHYDWRLGAARRLGRYQIEAAWAAGGPNKDFYRRRPQRAGGPLVSLTAAF